MGDRAGGIGKKLAVGFAGPLLLLIGVSLLSWRLSHQQLESSRWVAHTYDVMARLEGVVSLVKDIETGGRGYAITGQESFFDVAKAARDAMPDRVAGLRTLTKDNPSQQRRLAELEPVLATHRDFVDRIVATRDKGLEPALALIGTGQGKQLTDDIRRRVDELRGEEQALLDRRIEAMDQSVSNLNVVLILAGLVAVLIVAAIGFLVGRDITRVVNAQSRLIDGVRDAVMKLGTATAELLAAATQQSSGAQEQAAAVTQTVTTVEEVTQTAEQASQRARYVADSAHRSVEVSTSGKKVVDETVSTIATLKREVETMAESVVGLAEQAQSISEIIATVDDIAEQSNLLALNAAIEASRAGETGRGFAVVAGEVKSLAGEAKRATAKVREILGDIQRRTNSAVLVTEQNTRSAGAALQLVSDAGERIKSLAGTISDAASAATQIAASAGQQAVGMTQIQQAIRDVSQVTTQSLASTKQIERAGQDLDGLTKRLQTLLTPHDPRSAGPNGQPYG